MLGEVCLKGGGGHASHTNHRFKRIVRALVHADSHGPLLRKLEATAIFRTAEAPYTLMLGVPRFPQLQGKCFTEVAVPG